MKYVILLLFPLTALAGPIHQYEFTVTGTMGALAGQTSTGVFSYESATGRVLGLHFHSFDFTWNGIAYDENDVLFGSAVLNPDGTINLSQTSSFFGNDCGVGFCGVTTGFEEWNVEFGVPLNLFEGINYEGQLFRYRNLGSTDPGLGTVNVSYLGTASVPAPGSLALLLGLLFLSLSRRPRKLRLPAGST